MLSAHVTAIPYDDVKTEKLKNGIIATSQDTKSPLATLVITVGAGTHHETSLTLGAATYLNAVAFQSSSDYSAFATTREAEVIGAKFSVFAGRDNISYVAVVPRNHAEKAAHILASAATKQIFHPWEIREQDERVENGVYTGLYDHTTEQLIDDAFQLAFRKNAGRSVFIPHHKVGKVSAGALSAFYNERFVASQITVAATGVEHAPFASAFQELLAHVPVKAVKDESGKYYGGAVESRHFSGAGSSSSIIAFNAHGYASTAHVNSAILATALAASGSVVHGSSAARINAAFSKAGIEASASSYSRGLKSGNEGLFAVTITTEADQAHKAVTSAAQTIKGVLNGGITEVEFTRAKNKVASFIGGYSNLQRAKYLGYSTLRTGTAASLETLVDNIQATPYTQFQEYVKSVAATKPVYASRGNLENTPYYDELGF